MSEDGSFIGAKNELKDTARKRDRTAEYARTAAGLNSTRLKHHWGQRRAGETPQTISRFSPQGVHFSDKVGEYSAPQAVSTPAAGLDSTRTPYFYYGAAISKQLRSLQESIFHVDSKKRLEGNATGNPVTHQGRSREPPGRTWRRCAYDHPAAQNTWKMGTTIERPSSPQTMSPKQWLNTKPNAYLSIRNQKAYFVAGAEDNVSPCSRKFYKADLPPSKAIVKYNDSMMLPYFERHRHSYSPKSGNRQLDASAELIECLTPFGNPFSELERPAPASERSNSQNSVRSDRSLMRSASEDDRATPSHQGNFHIPSPGNTLPAKAVFSGGYPVQKNQKTAPNRPKYERAMPGTGSASAETESFKDATWSSFPSSTPSKAIPRSPLTWAETTGRSPVACKETPSTVASSPELRGGKINSKFEFQQTPREIGGRGTPRGGGGSKGGTSHGGDRGTPLGASRGIALGGSKKRETPRGDHTQGSDLTLAMSM